MKARIYNDCTNEYIEFDYTKVIEADQKVLTEEQKQAIKEFVERTEKMTLETEKQFFDNFGIKPFIFCSKPVLDCNGRNDNTCTKSCEYYSGVCYPEFTVEKQLEIIKLLCNHCDLSISHFSEWEFIYYNGQESLQVKGKDFTETLEKLISTCWQLLVESEKEQIKEILR